MKVAALSFVFAALSLATQVSAGPISIYVLSPEHPDAKPAVDNVSQDMRWGLAAAGHAVPQSKRPIGMMGEMQHHNGKDTWIVNEGVNGNGFQHHEPTGEHMTMGRHRCGRRMRIKAIALSVKNWLRERVGLPSISPPHFKSFQDLVAAAHHPERMHHEGAIVAMSLPVHMSHIAGQGDGKDAGTFDQVNHLHPVHHLHHHWRPTTFTGRLQKALMALGPWEGRIVAFVIGCGIGSLLRMFYVLLVLACRSFVSRRDEEAEVDVLFAEIEDVTPPPKYTDEKVAPVDEEITS
ncbi:hypothetical protein EW145_g1162 [Phellinidium pouzarii]|uniref:Uncharacterized protein n=1 Tax=Phellinidium pouzarii TaxID=167371 RepID=A0A4S4LFQ4_9AGAM|nr:hypothetical protein EW145_g1162 [Phellinidium pouzarii]